MQKKLVNVDEMGVRNLSFFSALQRRQRCCRLVEKEKKKKQTASTTTTMTAEFFFFLSPDVFLLLSRQIEHTCRPGNAGGQTTPGEKVKKESKESEREQREREQRLSRRHPPNPIEFFSTHPSSFFSLSKKNVNVHSSRSATRRRRPSAL